MITNITLVGLIVVILGWHFYCEIQNRKERKELLNRVMARSYVEYEYYDKKFPQDIKTVREAEKTLIKNEKTAAQEVIELTPEQQNFMENMDEDWPAETVDYRKLREIVNEPPRDREEDTFGPGEREEG